MSFEKNQGSSRHGARGRIAQVLAQARASLAEPSRPHTPQSLDSRTTSLIPASFLTPLRITTKPHGRRVSSSFHNDATFKADIAEKWVDVCTNSHNDDYKEKKSNQSKSADLQLVLLDIKDYTCRVEELSAFSLSFRTQQKDASFDSNKIKTLLDLSQVLDRLAKLSKSAVSIPYDSQRELDLATEKLARALCRITEETQDANKTLRVIACRHILRLYVPFLYSKHTLQQSASAAVTDAAQYVLHALRVLHNLQSQQVQQVRTYIPKGKKYTANPVISYQSPYSVPYLLYYPVITRCECVCMFVGLPCDDSVLPLDLPCTIYVFSHTKIL